MFFTVATASAPVAVSLGVVPVALTHNLNRSEYATGFLAALDSDGPTPSPDWPPTNTKPFCTLEISINRYLTVFALSSSCINALGNSLFDDVVSNLISCHILSGSYSNNQTDDIVIALTAFTNSSVVFPLPGRPQIAFFTRYDNGTTHIKEPLSNASFTQAAINRFQHRYLLVHPVDKALTVLGNLTTLAVRVNSTQLAQLLTTAGLLHPLENVSWHDNNQLQALVSQHALNGTIAYCTAIPDSAVDGAGLTLFSTKNDTGVFVKIIRINILFHGGVVHTIDSVLVEIAADLAKANDAATSAATSGLNPHPNNGSDSSGDNTGAGT